MNFAIALGFSLMFPAFQNSALDARIASERAPLEALYKHLHSTPELSYAEEKTSARIAEELKKAGFEVTQNIGKYKDPSRRAFGVVGILKNGEGPTILVRTDLDGLPVEEKTNVPYASKATGKNDQNEDVATMHACGHDMHMTVFVGTARVLSSLKNEWKGTLLFVAQPAEERAPGGAEAMLNDGLYTKFGTPRAAFALHCNSSLETGKIGYVKEYALANADTVDITVRGAGGHGAYPNATKDPIVLAAQMILSFQTIVSREIPPGEPAVVTVGSIHGGTKHNIIPDEVKLQLTVRSYSNKTRDTILNAIKRIAKGTAEAAGVPKDREPIVNLNSDMLVPATYNNPDLTDAVLPALKSAVGASNVVSLKPVLGAEDFGHYSLPDHSIPCVMLWLGTVSREKIEANEKSGAPLPSLHSSLYAPEIHPTIETGVKAMATIVMDRMN
ncbi:MAG: M20 family metallopeptidase [Planctomycetota bacterium]